MLVSRVMPMNAKGSGKLWPTAPPQLRPILAAHYVRKKADVVNINHHSGCADHIIGGWKLRSSNKTFGRYLNTMPKGFQQPTSIVQARHDMTFNTHLKQRNWVSLYSLCIYSVTGSQSTKPMLLEIILSRLTLGNDHRIMRIYSGNSPCSV